MAHHETHYRWIDPAIWDDEETRPPYAVKVGTSGGRYVIHCNMDCEDWEGQALGGEYCGDTCGDHPGDDIPSATHPNVVEAVWEEDQLLEDGTTETVRKRGKQADIPSGATVIKKDIHPHQYAGIEHY